MYVGVDKGMVSGCVMCVVLRRGMIIMKNVVPCEIILLREPISRGRFVILSP